MASVFDTVERLRKIVNQLVQLESDLDVALQDLKRLRKSQSETEYMASRQRTSDVWPAHTYTRVLTDSIRRADQSLRECVQAIDVAREAIPQYIHEYLLGTSSSGGIRHFWPKVHSGARKPERRLDTSEESRPWFYRSTPPGEYYVPYIRFRWKVGLSKETGLSDPRSWIGAVNPKYTPGRVLGIWENNCGDCTRACALTIEGTPTAAWGVIGVFIGEMHQYTGQKQRATTAAEIEKTLLPLSEGSYAIVGVDYDGGGGHWFLAYRDANKVMYMDGQDGSYDDWPPSFKDPVKCWDFIIRARTSEGKWEWMN